MGNYTRLYQIQDDVLAGVAVLAAKIPIGALGVDFIDLESLDFPPPPNQSFWLLA